MLADLAIVRSDLDDDPAGRWHHARMVADWGLDYYRAELEALDRLARAESPSLTRAHTTMTSRSLPISTSPS